MSFQDMLRESAESAGNILCIGLDPVIERIPLQGEKEEVIVKFYSEILHGLKSEDVLPAMVKPNSAFYEQYGLYGLRALKRVIKMFQAEDIMVCLDAKRGDIGKTSTAYAKSVFDILGADAVTLSPYLGRDSLEPFFREDKGSYVLVRTSNPGARDLQDLQVDGKPLYLKVAEKLLAWGSPSLAGVVGATYPEEMKHILQVFTSQGKDLPLLVPGVGAQGGSVQDVLRAIKEAGSELSLHRVNSSSGINYAYEKEGTEDFVGAAVRKAKELAEQLKI